MGQDQSKGDGASRQLHPKFQNIKATGNSGATSSKTSIPSTSRPTTQKDETGISSSATPVAATSHTPISQAEKSHHDTSVFSSEMRNQTIYPTSQSSTLTNNLRQEENLVGTSTSRTREVEPSTSREPFPKAVPFSGKLHTPMRDVRHVPSYDEQIKLNSASTGNPFLSPNFDDDNKPENKSKIQIDSKDNLSLDSKTFQIYERLEKLYSSGVLERMDLDKLALKTLHNLALEDALNVIDLFVKSNPKTKANKSAYLCSIIKHNINNQDVGDSKTFGQNQESRGCLSPNFTGSMPFSSQNKSKMYPNHIQTSPTKSNNIFGERDKQTDMKIQQSSTVSFIPEVFKENQFPLNDPIFDQTARNNENKEMEKRNIDTLNTTENAHFSNDYKTKMFEPNPSTTFGQQTPVTKGSRMASKVKMQFKRNVSKSHHPVKLSTLDKLAENICSFKKSTQTNENIFSKVNTSPNISMVDTKDKFTALSFEDCLKEMKNIEFQPQEKLDLLQLSVYSNLKIMGRFITGLKSFPLLNDQIISEINILQENIISFSKDKNRSCSNSNVFPSVANQRTCADPEQSQPPSRVSPYNMKCMDHEVEYSSSNIPLLTSNVTEEAKQTKRTSNTVTSLQSSISLAERLDELQIEKAKGSNFDSLKNKEMNTFELGQNHQNILDVVYSSCENNYTVNTIYICLPCDAFFSDQNGIVEHIKQHQIEKAKWHSCETCALVIYGTDVHYQIHCSSEKHHNIMRIKSKKSFSNEDVRKQSEWDEEKDDVSVTSSKEERKNPHEILLMIAKQLKNKNKINGTVGLYCRVCNKYYRFKNNDKHGSQLHIKDHLRSKSNNYSLMPCSTCHVELFGDYSLLYEHENMEVHKELAVMRKKNMNTEHNTNIGVEYQISNEEGPHYELMNKVLKKHLDNEQINNSLGYYCHLCQTYTLDEKQWQIHVNSSSHSYRINSPDCARKKMFNVCLICKIHLICDDHVFTLHEQSLAHDLVVRLQNSRSNLIGAQSVNDDEELSQEESDDTDDENEVDKYSDSHSTTSSNRDTNKNSGIPIGIKVTGINPNILQSDVFQTFKHFGHIKQCNIVKSGRMGTVIFTNKDCIQKVLDRRDFYIKGIKVGVWPFLRAERIKRPKEIMNASVIDTLKSQETLKRLIKELVSEVTEVSSQFEQRRTLIEQDILRAMPGCRVHIFGSQYTGLATRESDFDIYIDHDGRSYFRDLNQKHQEEILFGFLNKFSNPNSGFRVCETVLEARVPILRIVHNRTKIPCDISCRSGLSMENSLLIRMLLSSDARVSWLVVTVKWWMRSNDLLGRFQFTSYATTWLVLFFLMYMQRNIISPISAMKEGCPQYSVGNWDCRFNRQFFKHFKTLNNSSKFKLLVEFFKFYGKFRFKNVVLCPLSATCISRKDFEQLNLPPEFQPYINKIMALNPERLRTATPICLQDPFDLSHNITKGVNRKDLQKFKRFCSLSAQLCSSQGFK